MRAWPCHRIIIADPESFAQAQAVRQVVTAARSGAIKPRQPREDVATPGLRSLETPQRAGRGTRNHGRTITSPPSSCSGEVRAVRVLFPGCRRRRIAGDRPAKPVFEPPGPGSWTQDRVHLLSSCLGATNLVVRAATRLRCRKYRLRWRPISCLRDSRVPGPQPGLATCIVLTVTLEFASGGLTIAGDGHVRRRDSSESSRARDITEQGKERKSRWWDSNPRPDDYKSPALPLRHTGVAVELRAETRQGPA